MLCVSVRCCVLLFLVCVCVVLCDVVCCRLEFVVVVRRCLLLRAVVCGCVLAVVVLCVVCWCVVLCVVV